MLKQTSSSLPTNSSHSHSLFAAHSPQIQVIKIQTLTDFFILFYFFNFNLIENYYGCRYGKIVRLTAEIVGKASLLSLESNERIALDDEIVKALICLLGNSNRRVWIAACNAVLDLSTTSLARQRLLKFSALYRLL